MAAPPAHLLIPPISLAAPGSLYQQIVDGVKREIGEGRLRPGSPLPSFRHLAEQLLVSVITVTRAYAELEREGIIYRRQGLGTFVADHADDRNREAKRTRALDLLREAVREAAEAGLTDADVAELLNVAIQHKGRGRP
jgi:GntR family transcriptional regulator